MLKRNLVANYLGQGWTALMGLAFIPLYIKYLGIEAYGLIGLFALLQASLSLLDMGITPTLSREMARFTGGTHSAQSIRDLLRSCEIIIIGMGGVIAAGIWAASDWLARDWLRVENLPVEAVIQACAIMGCVTALRIVEGLYRSCIVGLQRHVLFNVVSSAMATLRGLGAVVILAWVSPSIEAFFIWQGIISILTVGVLSVATYQTIPSTKHSARFSLAALSGVRRYAVGVMGITFLSLLLMQTDKLLLSKLLDLSDYGYYSFAAVVSAGLYIMVSPIGQAWFPRLSELHARKDQAGLIETYHQGAQLVTVLMGSAAVVLIVFVETILHIWTQDTDIARHSATLVRLLALGNLLNGLMWIPYQTQLAHGWTGLTVRINIISVIIIVPAILWVTPRYGAVGAAWVWVSLNAGYVLIGVHFMYRKILIGEKWRWYLQDIILPITAASTGALLVRWAIPQTTNPIGQLAVIFLASGVTVTAALTATLAVAPKLRQQLRSKLLSYFRFMDT